MRAASAAMEMAFGKKPVLHREGGSIPVVAWFKEKLGVDSVLMGFGLPDDAIHACPMRRWIWIIITPEFERAPRCMG